VHDEPEKLIMKLEGKMVGAWVSECRRAWTTLSSSVSTGKLALDLRGLTFVDESGLDLLREIYRATRAGHHDEFASDQTFCRTDQGAEDD
jgi:anti-anti-sigma regulatory factor